MYGRHEIMVRSNGTVVQDQKCTDFNFCLLNAQSLNNKAGEFTDFICEYKPDVIALTERWLSQSAFVWDIPE